jgi:hypothetical protein
MERTPRASAGSNGVDLLLDVLLLDELPQRLEVVVVAGLVDTGQSISMEIIRVNSDRIIGVIIDDVKVCAAIVLKINITKIVWRYIK